MSLLRCDGDGGSQLLLDQFLQERVKRWEWHCKSAQSHLRFDQVVSALSLGTELVVGTGHLLSNLSLDRVHLISRVTGDLRGRWGRSGR